MLGEHLLGSLSYGPSGTPFGPYSREFGYRETDYRYHPQHDGANMGLFVEHVDQYGWSTGDAYLDQRGVLAGDFGIEITGNGPAGAAYDSETGQEFASWGSAAPEDYFTHTQRWVLDISALQWA